MRPNTTLLFGAIALLGWPLAGCGSKGTEPDPGGQVASIVIDQGSFAIERGFHQNLTATVKDKSGGTVNIPVVWFSSNEKVATVDANARLTAVDTGTAIISASTLGAAAQPIAVRVVWQGAAKIAAYQYTPPAAASPSATLPDSIRVQVTDLNGNPVPNAKVLFSTAAGGGTVNPTTAKTNGLGVAATQWTLGNSFGANQVNAVVVSDDDTPLTFVGSSPAAFTITTFQALQAVSGDNQTGQILSKLPVAPTVKLVDASGNPRAGVPVTFTATGNGRVVTAATSTGADGTATPGTWTLGDISGDQQLIVKVESATLTLHATGTGTAIHFIATTVAAGGFATCAIISDGTVNCWGEQPKVGDGTSINRPKPTPTSGGIRFSNIAGSFTHFCGVGSDQAVYCWGTNALVDITGGNAHATVPTKLASGLTWSTVAPGYAHNCALSSDGTAYCWGINDAGQLGDPSTTTTRYTPAAVSGGFVFSSIVSGSYHSCALTAAGVAFCWGQNVSGQIGDNSTTIRKAPTAVSGGISFKQLAAGDSATCGLSTAGVAYCWGRFQGVGTTVQMTPQSYTGAPIFSSISVGGAHACALTSDGSAYCWGNNVQGQLGDSTKTNRTTPTAVAGTMKFSSIHAGYAHTCARTIPDGAVACWGLNRGGELGDSTTTTPSQLVPRYIVLGVTP